MRAQLPATLMKVAHEKDNIYIPLCFDHILYMIFIFIFMQFYFYNIYIYNIILSYIIYNIYIYIGAIRTTSEQLPWVGRCGGGAHKVGNLGW